MVQGWKVGDKLEALDLHDTEHDLAYVATVSNVMEVERPDSNLLKAILIVLLCQGRVLIHFDGWSINHDYWARPDGPYLHPVGWAAGSKRKLIPPQDSQVRGRAEDDIDVDKNSGHPILLHLGCIFGQSRGEACPCLGFHFSLQQVCFINTL